MGPVPQSLSFSSQPQSLICQSFSSHYSFLLFPFLQISVCPSPGFVFYFHHWLHHPVHHHSFALFSSLYAFQFHFVAHAHHEAHHSSFQQHALPSSHHPNPYSSQPFPPCDI